MPNDFNMESGPKSCTVTSTRRNHRTELHIEPVNMLSTIVSGTVSPTNGADVAPVYVKPYTTDSSVLEVAKGKVKDAQTGGDRNITLKCEF